MSGLPFANVDAELERWREAGLSPRIWLRDDDAFEPTPALDRLIALSNASRAPLLLAVVPRPAAPAIAERLADEWLVTPAVHGYAHRNHAPVDQRKTELIENASRGRSVGDVISDLAAGRLKLGRMFGPRLSGVLVPPWNRISPAVAMQVATAGFTAVSLFGWKEAAGDLPHLNTHVDLIDWRNGRIGRDLRDIAATLAARLGEARLRRGAAVGLLTHHLVHDETAWRTLEALLDGLAMRGIVLATAAECLPSRPHE